MRGQQSLFSSLLFEKSEAPAKQRSRNYYQPERNEALLHRYYFHAEINRYRYDDCIAKLEQEFYLTAPRIIVILTQNTGRLTSIVNDHPTIKELADKFPHFSWKLR